MTYLNSVVMVALVIGLSSCAGKTVYVDRPVEIMIPVKCQVPDVDKPVQGVNMSESMLNIKEYIFKLEAALAACK
jgi:hypothetical protein